MNDSIVVMVMVMAMVGVWKITGVDNHVMTVGERYDDTVAQAIEHAKMEWIIVKHEWKKILFGAIAQYVHRFVKV